MFNNRTTYLLAALLVLISGTVGCGGGGGGTGGGGTTAGTVTGVAAKGPFTSGTAQAFILDVTLPNGKGAAISAATPLDSNSRFSLTLTSAYSGPILVEVYGTYTDEVTGLPVTITAGNPLRGAAIYSGSGTVIDNVTALNHLALARALHDANGDQTKFEAALASALAEISSSFNLTSSDLTSSDALNLTTGALRAIAQSGLTNGMSAFQALEFLSLKYTGTTSAGIENVYGSAVPNKALLLIGNATFTPAIVGRGQAFTAQLTVTNSGSASALVTAVAMGFDQAGYSANLVNSLPLTIGATSTVVLQFQGTVPANGSTGAIQPAVAINAGLASTFRAAVGTLTVTAVQPAALAISNFSLGAATVAPGGQLAGSFQIANTGGREATSVALALDFGPAQSDFTVSLNPATITTLATGTPTTVNFTITAAAGATARTVNVVATASGTEPAGTISATSTAQSFTVQTPAALQVVSVTANPTTQYPGLSVAFTVVVTNTGDVTASGVAVTPPATSATGFASYTAVTGSATIAGHTNQSYTFSGTLSSNATLGSLQVIVAAAATGLTAVNGNTSITVAPLPVPILSIVSVTPSPSSTNPNSSIGFSVVVTNTGTAAASNVVVTPPATAATGFASFTSVTGSSTIAIGANQTYTFNGTLSATATPGTLPVTVTAQATGLTAVSGSTSVFVENRAMTGSGVAVPTSQESGASVAFAVTLNNTGNVALSGVSLTLPATSPTGFASFTTPAGTNSIAVGGSTQFTFNGTLGFNATSGLKTVQLTANAIGLAASVPVTVDVTATPRPANLALGTVTASKSTVSQSQSFTVTFVVTNSGQVDGATTATVSFTPAGVVVSPVNLVQVVAQGGQMLYSFDATVDATATPGTFTANVTVQRDGAANLIGSTSVLVQSKAALLISGISVAKTTLSTGQTTTATLTVQNTGQAAANVSAASLMFSPQLVVDKMPSGLQFSQTAVIGVVDNTTYPLVINGGGQALFTYTLTGSTEGTRSLTNATITAKDGNNTTADVVTTVSASPVTLTVNALPSVSASLVFPQPVAKAKTKQNYQLNGISNRTRVTRGQSFNGLLTLMNAGPGAVTIGSAPTLTFNPGTGIAAGVDTTSTFPLTLTSGGSQVLNYTVAVFGTQPTGVVQAGVTASGTADTGAAVSVSSTNLATFAVDALPVLTLNNISGPASATLNTTFTGSVDVSLPAASAGIYNITLSLSDDAAVDLTFVALGTNATTLSAGQTKKLTYTVTVPAGATLGTHTITVGATFKDINSDNQYTATATTAQVKIQNAPSLSQASPIITSPAGASKVSRDQTAVLSWTVTNATNSATARISQVLSVVSDAGIVVTTTAAVTGAITEGNTYTYRANLAIGPSVPVGTQSITVTVQTSDDNNGTTGYNIVTTSNFTVQTTPTAITALAPSLPTTVAQGERGIVVVLPISFLPIGSADITLSSLTWQFLRTTDLVDVSSQFTMNRVTTFPLRIVQGSTANVSYTMDVSASASMAGIRIRPDVVGVTDANTGRDLSTLVARNVSDFTVGSPKPILRITGLTLSPTKVSVPQQIYTTLTVQNLGAASANLVTVPIDYVMSSGVTNVTSEYTFTLITTATTQIPGYQTRSFEVQLQVKPTATTYGEIDINAGFSTLSAYDGTPATTQALDLGTFTVYKGSASNASFTRTAFAPGAIEKTSLASGASTTYQAKVELEMVSLSNVADATVSNLGLAMKIGTATVTAQYDTGTAPSQFTISAGNTKRVTWNVTALNTAEKGQAVTLEISGTLTDSNSSATITTIIATDCWYVRDGAVRTFPANMLTSDTSGSTATKFNTPQWFLVDSAGRIIVSDSGNSRVLIYASESDTDPFVLGQMNNTSSSSNGPNFGSAGPNTLSYPGGLAVAQNRLFIADSSNNRVVMSRDYTALTTRWGAYFDAFIGQGAYVDSTANRGSITPVANGLSDPRAVAVTGTSLLVSDTNNSRVLLFANATAISTNPDGYAATATAAIGQTSLTTGLSNQGVTTPTAASLSYPEGLAFWKDSLVVADASNNRVLVYSNFPTMIATHTTGLAADKVVGQGSFTTRTSGATSSALYSPRGVFVAANKLFVADKYNYRVLAYSNFESLPTTGAVASDLFGQESYTTSANDSAPTLSTEVGTSKTAISGYGLDRPRGLWSSNGQTLWVADRSNHRLLVVPLP